MISLNTEILKFRNVKSLDAIRNYLTLKVGELFNNLKRSAKYSNVNIGTINAKVNTINITARYTRTKHWI